MAIATYVFREPRKGIIAHTAISKLLAEDPLVHQGVGIVCDEAWPSGSPTIDAKLNWPNSQVPHQTGISLNSHTGEFLFDKFAHDSQRAQRFADAMKSLQPALASSLSHLFNNLDWETEDPTSIVDMGASHGSVSIKFIPESPASKCIVEDLPKTLNSATTPPT